jgi:glucosylceramidase
MSASLRTWIETTETAQWRACSAEEARAAAPASASAAGGWLALSDSRDQSIDGFGGCFNELGMEALRALPCERMDAALDALFGTEEGCRFSLCRLPIGASDYALDWYSLDESPDDFRMERFSIERDRRCLIPYVKEAMRRQGGLEFFASPWSPPTWMKSPAVYNSGRLRMEDEVLRAYALYFLRYVRAYRDEGIEVSRIHVQNEPFADQKFPSCLWSADQFIVFIRDYLGPLFECEGERARIWLGTLNGPEEMSFGPTGIRLDSFDDYVERILLDEGACRYIAGIGYQWAGRANVQRTRESWPEIKIMQTENECGDGRNSWDYAFYVFKLIRHYLANGAISYAYWNMILKSRGVSTWGWPQNSMITVDPSAGDFVLNPEYFVMKHFSRYVAKGARRVPTSGRWSSSSLVFENPDSSLVVVAANLQPAPRRMDIVAGGRAIAAPTLAPRSINSLVFG